jgi:hypothetical protein
MLGTMAGYSGIYYPTIERDGPDDSGPPRVTEEYYYLCTSHFRGFGHMCTLREI